MTRETKIGLLVGLGFIVVFSVLLSHTGALPEPGDGLPSMTGPWVNEPAEDVAPGPWEAADFTLVTAEPSSGENGDSRGWPSPAVSPIEAPLPSVPASDRHDGLPAVSRFELPPVAGEDGGVHSRPIASEQSTPSEPTWTENTELTTTVSIHRVAPEPVLTVPAPEKTVRPYPPTETPAPAVAITRNVEKAAPPTAKKVPSRPYVVAKGETLGEISQKVYGTASVRVVNFLVEKNKGRIKSKDLVFEGQELLIPELPADQFEAVTLDVAKVNRSVRSVNTKELANHAASAEKQRRAPKPLPRDRKPSDNKARDSVGGFARNGDPSYHWYEVQPNDTLSSIAGKELGSSRLWHEIQQLNKQVVPTKMRPGMKIRLPKAASRSLSADDRRVAT